MPVVRVTQPSIEPLSVGDAMAYVRAYNAEDTGLIIGLISSARDLIEMSTGRAMISQQFRLTLPNWWHHHLHGGAHFVPGPLYSDPHINFHSNRHGYIELPRSPLISVDSVKYYDTANTLQVWDASNYIVLPDFTPGRIQRVDGVNWPDTASRLDAIQVTFTAGYGTNASAIPPSLIQALRFLVKHYYDNRDSVVVERATVDELPMTMRNLIEMHRVDFVA